jgi:hypothetical protein
LIYMRKYTYQDIENYVNSRDLGIDVLDVAQGVSYSLILRLYRRLTLSWSGTLG